MSHDFDFLPDDDALYSTQESPAYLVGLNDAQYRAVTSLEKSLLVLAGAGTGKTRVLTTRIAHILYSGLARPWDILAVTFTNKAAKEIAHRIGDLLGKQEALAWSGTFHSISAKILRRHAPAVGLQSSFTILNDDDQERLLKQILEADGADLKRTPAKVMLAVIDRWKNKAYLPKDVPMAEIPDIYHGKAVVYYTLYQERLRILNAVDFGDLLLLCITLFKNNPDILSDYHRRFKYILVDEYQDTNIAQYLWLRLLGGGAGHICCVGDDDQSIYGWRGAEIGNILKFEQDFKNPQIIRLEQNYRSTPIILKAASGLISHNQGRLGKTLYSKQTDGEKITLSCVWDGEEEARHITQTIEDIHRSKKITLSDIAILVRTSSQMRVLEERLITCAIAYRVIGGLKFYERAEIRDALAYLRLVAQPHDDLAFERILNKPKRGLGEAMVKNLREIARTIEASLYVATVKLLETQTLRTKARTNLMEFMQSLMRWIKMHDQMPLGELVATILEESGYIDMLRSDKSPDSTGRLENIKELVRSTNDYENLQGFLEHIALVMDNNSLETEDKVTIMTLHAAKGLEFHTVFLPGWEDGLFPSQKTMDENGTIGIEEERRLAYVALTRAKQKIYLSFAQNRQLYNRWQSTIPSRFIDDIPKDCIISQHPTYFASPRAKNIESEYEKNYVEYKVSPWQKARERFIEHRDSVNNFQKGDIVTHSKFGKGKIISAEGDKLLVQFDTEGFKNILSQFVQKV